MKKKLEQRLYGLVMYNLSPIQQGIQFGHANDVYKEKYGKDKAYQEFLKKHKTYIIYNGGTSNDGQRTYYGYPKQLGTMEQHLQTLKDNKIKCASFYEPDLNYALSSIVFLVDERVFNKKDYPDLDISDMARKDYSSDRAFEIGKGLAEDAFTRKVGKDVAFLKKFLKPFKFA